VRRARASSRLRSPSTWAGCGKAGTTTFEAKSGYGLDHDTELAQLRAIAGAGGIPTWLGAHTVAPEFSGEGADAYVDFLVRDVLPEAARLAEAADVFLERGAFDAAQARRYLTPAARRGSYSVSTATSSRSRARSSSRSSSERARSTISKRPASRVSSRSPKAA
jgi:imidazolonepropionase-like amidohydrolase